MLTLLVMLVVLALIVFVARAVLRGMGAPAWLDTVMIGLALIFAVVLIANAFGIATPGLR